MRPFPHRQYWSDWLTQYWNILLGRRATAQDDWLLGPTGEVGGIGESIIHQLARSDGLAVTRAARAGLLEPQFFSGELGATVHPAIVDFYTRTSEYDMEVWTRWEPFWGMAGRLVDAMFARRVDQLRLPANALATSRGVSSEIVQFTDTDGTCRHTMWLRKLKSDGTVIYAGFYYHVSNGQNLPRIKVVFPLPHGSATVVMSAHVLADGRLRLSSAGERFGDPGFYFVVNDRRSGRWIHYLRAFHEQIDVGVDSNDHLRAEHTMMLWGRLCYSLHYKVTKRTNP